MGNIVVVDDEPASRDLIAKRLRVAGYTCQTLASGPEMLNCLATEAADLVLLDVCMPGMSGQEACRRVKADPRMSQVPVIFVSIRGDVHERIAGLSAGASDYIVKPFQADELLARVANALRRTLPSTFAQADDVYDRGTSLLSRVAIEEQLHLQVRNAADVEQPVSCILFDLDHFTSIDERYGEAAADLALRAAASVLQARLRRHDAVGRWDRDQFLAVFQNVPIESAAGVAERLRQAIAETRVRLSVGSLELSVSVGVAGTIGAHAEVSAVCSRLVSAAQRAARRAKDAGRNRVCVDSEAVD